VGGCQTWNSESVFPVTVFSPSFPGNERLNDLSTVAFVARKRKYASPRFPRTGSSPSVQLRQQSGRNQSWIGKSMARDEICQEPTVHYQQNGISDAQTAATITFFNKAAAETRFRR